MIEGSAHPTAEETQFLSDVEKKIAALGEYEMRPHRIVIQHVNARTQRPTLDLVAQIAQARLEVSLPMAPARFLLGSFNEIG